MFYQARVFGALGHTEDVHLVTRCAPEDRELLVEPLDRFGLTVTWRPARETQSFSFHYEGERRVMDVVALGDPWPPDDVDGWVAQAIGDTKWIMLGGLTRAHFPAETLAALRRAGASRSSMPRGACDAGHSGDSCATARCFRRASRLSARSS